MYTACKSGKLPTIETMCVYGMSGFKGNPVALFECYKHLVESGVTEDELTHAMERGALGSLIMKSPGIQESPYYLEVMKHGGVSAQPPVHFECETCGYYSLTRKCSCAKSTRENRGTFTNV